MPTRRPSIMSFTGLAYEPSIVNHKPLNPSLESTVALRDNTARIEAAIDLIESRGFSSRCIKTVSTPATVPTLLQVHSKDYIDHIKTLSATVLINPAASLKLKKDAKMVQGTFINATSYNTALLSAGSVLQMVTQVQSGRLKNGLVLTRPPGATASIASSTNSAIFNSVACGVAHAKSLGCKRVMVVSLDALPATGAMEIFEEDDTVMCVSVHGGSRQWLEGNGIKESVCVGPQRVGKGKGKGYNVNIGFNRNGDHNTITDADVALAFSSTILPLGQEFRPDILLFSVGFGCVAGDYGNVAGFQMTTRGYSYVVHLLMKLTNGRMVVVCEGGYNPRSYSEAVVACLGTLLGDMEFSDLGDANASMNKRSVSGDKAVMNSPQTKANSLNLLARMRKGKNDNKPVTGSANPVTGVGCPSADSPGADSNADSPSAESLKLRANPRQTIAHMTSSNIRAHTTVIKSGWMFKQGHFISSWKKRYFVLSQGVISYYSSDRDVIMDYESDDDSLITASSRRTSPLVLSPSKRSKLKGQIALYGAVVDTLKDKPALKALAGRRNCAERCIYIVGRAGEKDFVIEADSEEAARQWCKAIRDEIHKCNDRRIRASFGDVTAFPVRNDEFPTPTLEGIEAIKDTVGFLKMYWKNLEFADSQLADIAPGAAGAAAPSLVADNESENAEPLSEDRARGVSEANYVDAVAPSPMNEKGREEGEEGNATLVMRKSPVNFTSSPPRRAVGRKVVTQGEGKLRRVLKFESEIKFVLKCLVVVVAVLFGRLSTNESTMSEVRGWEERLLKRSNASTAEEFAIDAT